MRAEIAMKQAYVGGGVETVLSFKWFRIQFLPVLSFC